MKPITSIKICNREDLKKFFRNGEIPSENHFHSLIDSTINKQDDGFSKDKERGLVIAAATESDRLLTFYKQMNDLEPFFMIEKDELEPQSLRLRADAVENPDEKSFFFSNEGSLGLGKRSEKSYRIDVKGFAAMTGRTGTFRQGKVPADGKWHTIVQNLDNCQAFEVVARTGKKSFGRFAILHAVALSAYGNSRSRIKKTSAHYGYFWNRIRIRWMSHHTHDYHLQIKTGSNYGENIDIYYSVGKLWDDELFLPDEYYY